jgi:HD-GYP domain-containing protein (c-di-GMP phosphodiesterase class II)
MHLASKMGYSKEDVLRLGNAALFHDIGKIFVSRRILKKKDQLTQDEFSQMRDHSVIGAKILLKYQDSLGMLPALIAFEHHLRYDLKGYPKLAFPYRPHPASFIVSLCDVYDALCQKRTYKTDLPPLKIYEVMTKEKGKLFDPELVDEFFKAMGVWPVGTIVILSDERIAVVREVNDKDIFRPKVEVVFPIDKRELMDLFDQRDKLEIKDYLSPFGEGRKYLDFI